MRKFDTTPPFPMPELSAIEAAIPAVWDVIRDTKIQRDGIIHIRADHLAEKIHKTGHSKAASHWAIEQLLNDGQLQDRVLSWGGVINTKTGNQTPIPQWKDLPWITQKIDTDKRHHLEWHQFEVIWEPAVESAEERIAKDVWRLGEPGKGNNDYGTGLVGLLQRHAVFVDGNGYSTLQTIIEALDARLQPLRIAAVNCKILDSTENLAADHIEKIKNHLIAIEAIEGMDGFSPSVAAAALTLEEAIKLLNKRDLPGVPAGYRYSETTASKKVKAWAADYGKMLKIKSLALPSKDDKALMKRVSQRTRDNSEQQNQAVKYWEEVMSKQAENSAN